MFATSTVVVLSLLFVTAACSPGAETARTTELESRAFSAHLEAMEGPPFGLSADGDHGVWETVRAVYGKTGGAPLWIEDRAPRSRATTLLDQLDAAHGHGLDPAVYAAGELRRQVRAAAAGELSAVELRDLDVALTSAAVLYGAHLLRGRVLPGEVEALWESREPEMLLPGFIASAIEGDALEGTFASLAPPHEDYGQLRSSLERYRGIVADGGWPEVPATSAVEVGDDAPHEVLTALVERLAAEDFVAANLELPIGGEPGTRTYSDELSSAVERFQASRTLAVDGKLGPNTVETLNVPAEDVVRSIRMSLDRWRWQPHDLGELVVMVNIPTYELFLRRDGKVADRMGVVVGKEGWPTAIIRDEIETIVFNPRWYVPRTIIEGEIVHKMRDNPSYLEEEGLEVTRDGVNGEVVPLRKVSAKDLADPENDLHVRQPAGPTNALGEVKFLFPNRENIYLHDTPADHLFSESDRTFSHGCVRVERPVDLAVELLGARNGWSRRQVRRAIDAGENRHVALDGTVPVFITYLTAIPGPEGGLVLGEDVYGLDVLQEGLAVP